MLSIQYVVLRTSSFFQLIFRFYCLPLPRHRILMPIPSRTDVTRALVLLWSNTPVRFEIALLGTMLDYPHASSSLVVGLKHNFKLPSANANSICATVFFHIQLYLCSVFVMLYLFCDPYYVLGLFNIDNYIFYILSNHAVYVYQNETYISDGLSLSFFTSSFVSLYQWILHFCVKVTDWLQYAAFGQRWRWIGL